MKIMLSNNHTIKKGEVLKVIDKYEDSDTREGYSLLETTKDITVSINGEEYFPFKIEEDGFVSVWEVAEL